MSRGCLGVFLYNGYTKKKRTDSLRSRSCLQKDLPTVVYKHNVVFLSWVKDYSGFGWSLVLGLTTI